MRQKLLTDIELDIQALKCLMNAFSNEPTSTLSELLKRNIVQTQERLGRLLQEVEAASVPLFSSSEEEEVGASVTDAASLAAEKVAAEEVAAVEDVVAPEVPASAKEACEEPVERPLVLGENIRLFSGELRKSVSLNDSFRFSRELFGGDTALMNRVMEQISVMSSYQSAVAFLSTKVKVDEEQAVVADFLELLKKYFNQSV